MCLYVKEIIQTEEPITVYVVRKMFGNVIMSPMWNFEWEINKVYQNDDIMYEYLKKYKHYRQYFGGNTGVHLGEGVFHSFENIHDAIEYRKMLCVKNVGILFNIYEAEILPSRIYTGYFKFNRKSHKSIGSKNLRLVRFIDVWKEGFCKTRIGGQPCAL